MTYSNRSSFMCMTVAAIAFLAAGCGAGSGKDDDAPPQQTLHDAGDAGTDASDALGEPEADPADAPPPDCSGSFGTPEQVMQDQTIFGISVTSDEREMAYVRGPNSDAANEPWLARRSSTLVPFAPARRLDELLPFCHYAFWDLDITADGLRLYFSCSQGVGASFVTDSVHFARRGSRDAKFEHQGTVSASSGFGKVSPDELSYTFTSRLVRVQMATRASRAVPFGPPQPVAGLQSFDAWALSLTPDGNTAYLAYRKIGSIWSSLGVVKRASSDLPFGEIEPVGSFAEEDNPTTPQILPSCRALYFTRDERVYVMRR